MREKDWKELFDKSRMPCPDPEEKKEQLRHLLQVYQSLRPTYRKTKLQRWVDAAGHLSPFTWLFQAVLLLLLGFSFMADWINAAGMAAFTAPLLGIASVLELMRSYAWNMWELEQSCRYHLPQMMGMKMVILGMQDLLILVALGAVGGYGNMGVNGFLILILIPFLLSNAIYLWLMKRFRNSVGIGILPVAGLFMSGLNIQVTIAMEKYIKVIGRAGCRTAIFLMTLASIGILAVSVWRFLKSCEGEEKKTWSFS